VASPAAEICVLRFGVFELDLRRQELRRGGVLIKLSPQQFRVLRMLAERGGQICTREEIQREIWGSEVFVDFDRGLNVCVAAIRSALNDDSEAPRFVQTVPRQGYRFVAPVEQVAAPAAPQPKPAAKPRYWWWIAAVAGCLVPGIATYVLFVPGHSTRLAVLPFENLTGEAADAPVALGLTDELTTQLGAADPARLAVIGRTSASRYAAHKAGLAELAVDYVIEGSIRTEAGATRIAVRLVEARGQTQVWNNTFQSAGSGRLELQETVAAGVARAVTARLFPRSAPPVASPYSADAQAAEAYWNGRYLDRKDPARAIQWFEQAAQRDPRFAAPRAAMAESWLAKALSSIEPGDAFPKARAAAEEALRIDERNAEAHAVLGAVSFWSDWNRRESRRHLERALSLNASLARAHHDYAFLLVEVGAADAGINELRTAIALDPLAPRVNLDAGWVFLQAHRFDEAVRYARRALDLEPRLEEAKACIARAELYQGKSGPEAVDALRRSGNAWYRAMGAAMTGRKEEALAALDEALARHSPMLVMLGTEPAFDRLRAGARFREIERKVGLL
jgi:DNA-binding winged helix-turn-helix (wHTH) protein/TolB-like protein/Tfp pilus assembly protein PilF